MYRHTARKQLMVSPHVSLTDCRGLGELLPPLCRIGPIARATGKQGHDEMTLRYVIVFPPITPRWEANNSCCYSGLVYTPIIPAGGLGGREGLGQEQDGCIMLRA